MLVMKVVIGLVFLVMCRGSMFIIIVGMCVEVLFSCFI